MNNRKPILVTGSHRSGTTWAGRMISAAPNVGYIHEPFNVTMRIGTNPRPFKEWYKYICEENEGNFRQIYADILKFKYPIGHNILKVRTARDLAKIIKNQLLFFSHYRKEKRPLIKDPIAFFSAEWLYKSFNFDVLVLIRHPAAFCSSLKIKGWRFDFNDLLTQSLLMRDFLLPFEKEIKESAKTERDITDQAILLWNCIHSVVRKYQDKYSHRWLFVKHEDLSLDPVNKFKSIYKRLNLEYTHSAQNKIKENTGEHNPIEQVQGNEGKRNSKENIMNWKNRLNDEEINRIKEGTKAISSLFYTESEW